jgi:hypothetical protein
MPGIEIEGVGRLSFPVPEVQVRALIDRATRAPYGRGPDTIVDESVRKVWQLPADQVRIGGRSWPDHLAGILTQATAGLGCAGMPVSAELYKLLVYDTGGFFLSHRDTEKTEGMFGTLVVVLPAPHHGGELIVRHGDREVTLDMDEHLSAPDAPAKIAWLLEHQYTPDGLSFAGLKSADAARLKVLAQAAERAGCTVHLGIVHLDESGAAEPKYYERHPRRWRRYDDDQDNEAASESAEFDVIEVADHRQYISQWRNLEDEPVEFGDIPLEDGELLPAGALDDEPPDTQRLTEASGNEGASFERSYHRAALVLWRRDRYAAVLLQAGVAAALPYLADLIRTSETGAKEPAAKAAALDLARRMVESWTQPPSRTSYYYRTTQPDGRDRMLRLLDRLGDATLLADFIRDTVTPKYDGTENHARTACARKLEPAVAATLYAGLLRAHLRLLPGPCVELLLGLTGKGKGRPNARGATPCSRSLPPP